MSMSYSTLMDNVQPSIVTLAIVTVSHGLRSLFRYCLAHSSSATASRSDIRLCGGMSWLPATQSRHHPLLILKLGELHPQSHGQSQYSSVSYGHSHVTRLLIVLRPAEVDQCQVHHLGRLSYPYQGDRWLSDRTI